MVNHMKMPDVPTQTVLEENRCSQEAREKEARIADLGLAMLLVVTVILVSLVVIVQ